MELNTYPIEDVADALNVDVNVFVDFLLYHEALIERKDDKLYGGKYRVTKPCLEMDLLRNVNKDVHMTLEGAEMFIALWEVFQERETEVWRVGHEKM